MIACATCSLPGLRCSIIYQYLKWLGGYALISLLLASGLVHTPVLCCSEWIWQPCTVAGGGGMWVCIWAFIYMYDRIVCVCLLVCLCVQLRHPCAGMCTCTPIVNSSKWGSFYYYNGVRCSPIQIYLSLIYLLPLLTVLTVQGTSCSNKCNYSTTCIFSVCVFARD